MKIHALTALACTVLLPDLQAQAPAGLTVVSSVRESLSQTFVFESPLSEHEMLEESAPSPIGPWLADVDLQAADPLGIPVGRARCLHDSDVQRFELSFDLELSMSTTGNHLQEDAAGSTTYRIQFRLAERMRFRMTARTAASLGYNRAVVDLYEASTPTQPIATVFSLGGFDPSSSGGDEGWLQPGEYVFHANCESLAGGGGAGPADQQSASAAGALQLYHECDYDLDGDVNPVDRTLFLFQWALGTNPEATDIDGDGDSDPLDALTFIRNWRRALRP